MWVIVEIRQNRTKIQSKAIQQHRNEVRVRVRLRAVTCCNCFFIHLTQN